MKKVNFIFCLHNHQPVGNFDDIFEANYRQAYEPFLALARQYPEIKLSLHYSGSLLEWIEHTHPKFITDIKSMVASRQVEIMGGGFCDPILTMLPEVDKIGQITYFSSYLKARFGTEPTGMWLAERVWEQYLTKYIARAGLKYTVVDDFHFRSAGVQPHKLDGFFITEEDGYCISIFPGSEKLRYSIPFHDPSVTIEILKSFANESGDKMVVYADDGEKFGSWPRTYEHCYQNKWLERFFQTLSANADWINFITFKEAIDKFKPRDKVYLPDGAYREMTEWALPTETALGYEDLIARLKDSGLYDKARGFIKGGFWRNFRAKYPEINLMHARMVEVSEKVNALNKKSSAYKKTTRRSAVERAIEALYHGQCNCPYWHGVFGGFYLPHLRHSIYKYLIKAERLTQATRGRTQECDFDRDGYPEIKLANKDLSCYFKPHQGGAMYEFDIIEKEFNPLATVTRRQEPYHFKIMKAQTENANQNVTTIHNLILAKEKGLENLLYYDQYPRMSLLDHFFNPDCKLAEVAKSHYCEEGDFLVGEYIPSLKRGEDGLLSLSRAGKIKRGDKEYPLAITKSVRLIKRQLNIDYRITNTGSELLETIFGVEFNLSMLAGNAHDRFYYSQDNENLGPLVSVGELKGQKLFGIKDWYQKIDIRFILDKSVEIWYFPVQTVSQSESGLELIYQNSVIIPHGRLQLKPQETWQIQIVKEVRLC